MKRTFILSHELARERALEAVRTAPDGCSVVVGPPTRTLEQNALLWPLLTALSEQVDWYGKHLSPENWKDVMTASLRKMDVVPNIEGTGFVALGRSTSQMGKAEFSDLVELIYAFGAEK